MEIRTESIVEAIRDALNNKTTMQLAVLRERCARYRETIKNLERDLAAARKSRGTPVEVTSLLTTLNRGTIVEDGCGERYIVEKVGSYGFIDSNNKRHEGYSLSNYRKVPE